MLLASKRQQFLTPNSMLQILYRNIIHALYFYTISYYTFLSFISQLHIWLHIYLLHLTTRNKNHVQQECATYTQLQFFELRADNMLQNGYQMNTK